MLRWYYSVDALTVLEITDRVDWPQIEIGGKANQDGWEGDLIVEDPDGDFLPLMFRRIYAVQDAAPAGGQVVGNWFISNLKVKRGSYKTLAGRTWVITMADENFLLGRRKFVGSDANRPAETDIARLRWALTTTEMNQLDPNEDYIDTTGPVNLDAADLRTQGVDELMQSLMTASGKQYWVMYREDLTPHVYTLWYAYQNSSALYASTLSLSNVASEVGDPESTLVYPLSGDAELDRAGGRMASGLIEQYKTNWIYLQDTDVGDAYAYIDRVATSKNVTSLAKATAEVSRQLRELALPDDEISTTVTVEEANLNLTKHGMILPVHATHFPNYTDDSDPDLQGYNLPGYADDFVNCRVMERTVRQVGPTTFELALRLSPMKVECPDATSGGLSFPPLNPPPGDAAPSDALGNIQYLRPGAPGVEVPTPFFVGSWTGWIWGSGGSPDYGLGGAGNILRFIVVGDGVATIPTSVHVAPYHLHARLQHRVGGATEVIDEEQEGTSGDTFTFTVSSEDRTICTHWIDVGRWDTEGPPGDAGYPGGATWTPD